MTTTLITDVQLAEDFGLTVERLHELRRRNHWPCVRLSRFEVRFTPDQVAAIVAKQTEAAPEPTFAEAVTGLSSVSGQTRRSAARRRAAP